MNGENINNGFSSRKALAAFAFFGFGVSLLVHLLTYFGVNVSRYFPAIWLLHIGLFVVNLPMIISIFLEYGRTWGSDIWQKVFAPMPQWARYVAYGFFGYAMLNFVIFAALSVEGYPDVVEGKYVLMSGGKPENNRVVREISEEEYDLQNARVIRGFSGHWMIFYLLPALYFWYPRSKSEES